MQHAPGTFSPYGTTGHPILQYMAQHGSLDKEQFPQVSGQPGYQRDGVADDVTCLAAG